MKINLTWRDTVIWICVVYTLITTVSAIFNLINGNTETTHFHILVRLVVTTVGIGSIHLFKLFTGQSLFKAFVYHYSITISFIILAVWMSGFFMLLHPNALRDIFLNYSTIYFLCASLFMAKKNEKS